MTGNFLLEQLRRMDTAAGGKATFAFGGTAFVSALTSEVSPSKSRPRRCLMHRSDISCPLFPLQHVYPPNFAVPVSMQLPLT